MIETDVLIAGYGPTGETLAALLGKAGIKTLVVERDVDVYRYPRAAHFDHEIMRIWQKLGITEAVLPWTRQMYEYEFRNAEGEVLLRFDQRGMEAPSGWAPSYMFHQPALEEALRKRVEEFPCVDVRLGASLKSIDANTAEGVTATITASGKDEQVGAKFLIGCDGGNSQTRRLIDGELFDYGFDEPWLVIDTVAKHEEGLPPFGIQLCDPKRPTTVVPMSPLRRRWEFMLKPGETPEEMLNDAKIAELLTAWTKPGQVEVIRKAVYRFHGLVAKTWRAKSVLIAGDAAHQMPPFMGQGMCSGIRDADNLAWKLIAVLQGDANTSLLDTYQQEREPQVRFIVEGAIGMGRVVCVQDEAAAKMRDQGMIAARAAATGPTPLPGLPPLKDGFLMPSPRAGELFPQIRTHRYSNGRTGLMDDVAGFGDFLIVLKEPLDISHVPWPTPVDLVALGRDITDPDGRLRAWFDKAGAEIALVRPDYYVFGTGSAEALASALASAFPNEESEQ
ncbi:MAG: bifunctional 3-(3-hydroxy-phenyl)propionate/3-hydroxycinnamic acid hydroxylase [Micropepsaceae bacterium]